MKKDLMKEQSEWIDGMKATGGQVKKAHGVAKYEQIITVAINEQYHGLELSFRFKPTADERATLKRDGWKWHYKKMVWYAANTPEHAATINKLHGTVKYPDGWNIPERVADDQDLVNDFIRNNIIRITEIMNEQFTTLEIQDMTSDDLDKTINGIARDMMNEQTTGDETPAADTEQTAPAETVNDQEPERVEIPANKYGVKVGDIFEASWGYDQTNVNFFQVIKLVGKTSVRVREIDLPMIEQKTIGSMAADRTYKVTHELLEPSKVHVFIDDQENGDLKRLKSYAADGVSRPQFKISSFADAELVTSDTITEYESWYA